MDKPSVIRSCTSQGVRFAQVVEDGGSVVTIRILRTGEVKTVPRDDVIFAAPETVALGIGCIYIYDEAKTAEPNDECVYVIP